MYLAIHMHVSALIVRQYHIQLMFLEDRKFGGAAAGINELHCQTAKSIAEAG